MHDFIKRKKNRVQEFDLYSDENLGYVNQITTQAQDFQVKGRLRVIRSSKG